jgi:formyltetrahydrofolate deformylase
MPDRQYVITLGCPDRTGIVARISGFLAESGGWITEAAYHADPDTNWFFTRQVVRADSLPFGVDELRERFGAVAAELGSNSDWRVVDSTRRPRVVVLVSREAHCLYDLLGRVAAGELDVDLRAVVGNHCELATVTRAHGIPFHHVPFPTQTDAKAAAFGQLHEPPWGEAGRRELPLRHCRTGCRADHRAGRAPGRPHRHRGRHGAQGSGH